jgi:hypothetical protein
MSDVRYVAIDPARLLRMRERGADEFGNEWAQRTAEGWEPLRCCLAVAEKDADIALICYTPWTEPSPWLAAGPVFVHFGRCGGYETPELYPEALRGGATHAEPVRPQRGTGVRSATAGRFAFEARPVR